MNTDQDMILPGNWLGVFGGGQLGRMFTHAAQRMGYHVAVLEPEPNSPAAQAADRHFCSSNEGDTPESLVEQMAELCSAITLEFENIAADLVLLAAAQTLTNPGVRLLEICQDRIREKSSLRDAGFPTTPFQPVSHPEEVNEAAENLGWPMVLKTARSGYDGKGQGIVRNPADVAQLWPRLESARVVAEKWIDFEAEVSMIAARNARGDIECYPLLENSHAHHILDITRCPAQERLLGYTAQATEICRGVAERFEVVGLFCIEFFITSTGELLINEIAPRPHNSGHLTIEAFTCSQFEQQVRAVCNLPLVVPQQIRPAAMANLLGDLWGADGMTHEPLWEVAMRDPAAHLHLYGKAHPRKGRKMGHLTVVGDDSAERAARIRAELRVS